MGLNTISWRRVKRLNARLDDRFIHAACSSHSDWWVWICVRHDGTALLVDTKTLETKPTLGQTSTQHLLATRVTAPHASAEWLAELDARQAELMAHGT